MEKDQYSNELLSNILKAPGLDCQLPCLHEGSCKEVIALQGMQFVKKVWKLYLTVHVLPYQIFKRKEFRKNPGQCIKNILIAFIRSNLYAMTSVMVTKAMILHTFDSKIISQVDLNFLVKQTFSSPMIFFEHHSRHSDIALYLFPRYAELVWAYLQKKKYVKSFDWFNPILFGLTVGLFCNAVARCESKQYKGLKGTYQNFGKYIVVDCEDSNNNNCGKMEK